VVIPNRKIVGEILHNYGRLRQLGIEVGVSYKTDIAAAVEAVREVLRANPRVLHDPVPGVGVARLGESCVRSARSACCRRALTWRARVPGSGLQGAMRRRR
jgi:small conductance mechanosensitive channel